MSRGDSGAEPDEGGFRQRDGRATLH